MSRAFVALTVIAVMVLGTLGAGEIRSSKSANTPAAAAAVSTHVLDSAAGQPVGEIPVRLERAGELLGKGKTDKDGRLELGPKRLEPGTYRLIFDLDRAGEQSFYPEITVTFRVTETQTHLHLPILLSPFAFTTYRGS